MVPVVEPGGVISNETDVSLKGSPRESGGGKGREVRVSGQRPCPNRLTEVSMQGGISFRL